MQESYLILKKAFAAAGTKKVASQLKLSQSLVYKWCQKKAEEEDWQQGGAVNPLDRVREIYQLTNDPTVITWICQAADGYFVKNSPAKKSNLGLEALRSIQMIIKEFSEALAAISKSYNDDKRIDPKEAVHIREAWEDLKMVGESFVKECERGSFNRGKAA